MTELPLRARWRYAAAVANEAAGPSYNAGDVHPDAADAAVCVVLEALLDYSGPYRYNQVELDAEAVTQLLRQIDPERVAADD